MQLLNKMMTFRYTYLPTHMLYIILVRIHIREMRTVRDWEPDHVQANCWLYVNWRRKNVGLVCQKKTYWLILILKNSPSVAIQFVHDLCLSLIIPFQRNVLYTLFWKSSIIHTYYIAQQFWVKTRWWWWYLITIYHSN